jgi:hypothetical protein
MIGWQKLSEWADDAPGQGYRKDTQHLADAQAIIVD